MKMRFGKAEVNYGLSTPDERMQTAILCAYIALQTKAPEEIADWFEKENVTGKIGDCGECAVANYFVKLLKLHKRQKICVSVAMDLIEIEWRAVGKIEIPVPVDSNVQKFIGLFDDNAFPELVEDEGDE